MIINMYGGGSNAVNFKVYTAATLPTTGSLNDVCIISTTSAPSWTMNQSSPPTNSDEIGTVSITYAASSVGNATFNALKKNALMVKLIKCWQYLNSGWSSMDAYYHNGSGWVKFSSAWTATINITYPEGSTCYVSNGDVVLTSPNTSGSWSCVVPIADTWTITCSNGSTSVSKVVELTTDGQTESVTLGYEFTYTYSGSSEFNGDATGDWELKLLTSGYFTMTEPGACGGIIDVFLLGGGGGGGTGNSYGGGGGGAGGYITNVESVQLTKGASNEVSIGAGGAAGASGGTTTAFNNTAIGGNAGENCTSNASTAPGGAGGSGDTPGGAPGGDGGNGGGYSSSIWSTPDTCNAGAGGTNSTKPFGTGSAYFANSGYGSGGGGGAGGALNSSTSQWYAGLLGAGGENAGNGGGAQTANSAAIDGTSALANYGGGGGGGRYSSQTGTSGGSGVVILRNHRT